MKNLIIYIYIYTHVYNNFSKKILETINGFQEML